MPQRLVAGDFRAGRPALKIYFDASALVKRYGAEPGSDAVRDAMAEAQGWYMCRAGFVETVGAIGLALGARAIETVKDEWLSFSIVEVDQALVEHAAALALNRDLRRLDSLHLASPLVLPCDDLTSATWDHRLHAAAGAEVLALIPGAMD